MLVHSARVLAVGVLVMLGVGLGGCPGAHSTDGGADGPVISDVADDRGSDGSSGSDGSMHCAVGQSLCGAACADTAHDLANCGNCGTACAAGAVCVAGACQAACPAGQTNCAGACFDLTRESGNCGACALACTGGMVCVASACVCPAGQVVCGGLCTDTQTNHTHCGMCGAACGPSEVCSGGHCGAVCGSGQTNCGGTCTDLQRSNTSCGLCDRACPPGSSCTSAACVCMPGQMLCGGACIDTVANSANCGICGRVCAAGVACVVGACAVSCVAPMLMCGANCVNPRTDATNCGACGTTCAVNQNCVAGSCALTNDSCATAAPIVLGAEGTVTLVSGTTVGSTDSVQTCSAGGDVWYSFTLTVPEIVYFDTFGSSTAGYNPNVGFAQACGVAAQSCNDDACGTLNSQNATIFMPGVHMLIVDTTAGAGPFTVRLQHMPISGLISGSFAMGPILQNVNTTGLGARPFSCGGAAPQPERSFAWATCPSYAGGMLTATTCTSAMYDTVLEARDGNAVGATCDDNSACGGLAGNRSTIARMIPPGAGIHVLSLGGSGGASGAAQITGNRP